MADLVTAGEIVNFPGAPFNADVLTAAGETVRSEAGWHIAPSQTDTLTLDSNGGCVLWLPTKKLTAVVEVRDVTGTTPIVLTGVTFTESGRLYRRGGFPFGRDAVEVEFTHGYAECPKDLLPIVAAVARGNDGSGTLTSRQAGPFRETYADGFTASDQAILDRYRLGWV